MKKKIKSVFNKKNKRKISCLTSYSYNFTKIIDGLVDVILVVGHHQIKAIIDILLKPIVRVLDDQVVVEPDEVVCVLEIMLHDIYFIVLHRYR